MKATHEISAITYQNREIELTFEDLDTHEKAFVTILRDDVVGDQLAKVVSPCVYHGAVVKDLEANSSMSTEVVIAKEWLDDFKGKDGGVCAYTLKDYITQLEASLAEAKVEAKKFKAISGIVGSEISRKLDQIKQWLEEVDKLEEQDHE